MKISLPLVKGRIVFGDAFVPNDKDMAGKPLVTRQGQPKVEYVLGFAIPKSDFAEFWQAASSAAAAGFPGMHIAPPWDPACRFAWKIKDGDSQAPDQQGRRNCDKPGWAGCWVVTFKSQFAPKCFHVGHYAPHEQINDAKAIPCGHWARVSGTVEANGDTQKPGLFMNWSMLEYCGGRPDEVIVKGPDAAAVFGGSPVQPQPGYTPPVPGAAPGVPAGLPGLPAALPGVGQQAAPAAGYAPAGAAMALPGMAGVAPVAPGVGSLPQGLPAAPGVGAALPSPGGVAVQPNPAFLAGAAAMQPPGMAVPAGGPTSPGSLPGMPMPTPQPAAPAPLQLTPQAIQQGYSLEVLRQQGHTDDQIRGWGLAI